MKINTSKIKEYFKTCFDKKVLIRKGLVAAAACALVLIFSLSFYFWLRNKPEGLVGKRNGFWYIEVVWNEGIAFGGMKGNLAGILALQSVVFVVMVAIYMFLSKDIVSDCFIACAMFGGLFNLIQRGATPNLGVLDYFKFGFMNFATFNWPDTFVVVGVFGFLISYIVWIIRQEEDEEEIKEDKAQTVVPPAQA